MRERGQAARASVAFLETMQRKRGDAEGTRFQCIDQRLQTGQAAGAAVAFIEAVQPRGVMPNAFRPQYLNQCVWEGQVARVSLMVLPGSGAARCVAKCRCLQYIDQRW